VAPDPKPIRAGMWLTTAKPTPVTSRRDSSRAGAIERCPFHDNSRQGQHSPQLSQLRTVARRTAGTALASREIASPRTNSQYRNVQPRRPRTNDCCRLTTDALEPRDRQVAAPPLKQQSPRRPRSVPRRESSKRPQGRRLVEGRLALRHVLLRLAARLRRLLFPGAAGGM
jgi:hypothetical protein